MYSIRHVGPDIAAAYGCRDLSPRADRSWHGYSLCRYTSPQSLLDASSHALYLLRSQRSGIRLQRVCTRDAWWPIYEPDGMFALRSHSLQLFFDCSGRISSKHLNLVLVPNGRVSAEKIYLMSSVMIVLIEIKKKYIEANQLVSTSFSY